MTLSIRLPEPLEQKLASYCTTHQVSQDEAIQVALNRLFAEEARAETPYDLGKDGFGADRTHGGAIARDSKRLLRMKFRGSPAG